MYTLSCPMPGHKREIHAVLLPKEEIFFPYLSKPVKASPEIILKKIRVCTTAGLKCSEQMACYLLQGSWLYVLYHLSLMQVDHFHGLTP